MTATEVCESSISNRTAIDNHQVALANYHLSAAPYVKAMCDLYRVMPHAFIQNPDGTLTSIGRDAWPEWAKDYAENIEKCISLVKEHSFKIMQ